jgi:hypothetical protein
VPDPTAAARQRRRRARLAGLEPPAPEPRWCGRCDALCSDRYEPLCQRCWRAVDPAGKAAAAQAVAASRQRQRDNL